MPFNKNHHHRRSIRLKGFDYTQAGLYFVTICVQHRKNLFGNVENGVMMLNDAGRMVEKWFIELENKFPDKKCHEMVVMPNHFHGIIENVKSDGAILRYYPDNATNQLGLGEQQGDNNPILGGDKLLGEQLGQNDPILGGGKLLGEHIGSPLHRVVQWFKTMSTNEYIRGVKQNGWEPFDGKLWQRNYWEHIIRDEQSYQRISAYIINNPKNWMGDKLNGK